MLFSQICSTSSEKFYVALLKSSGGHGRRVSAMTSCNKGRVKSLFHKYKSTRCPQYYLPFTLFSLFSEILIQPVCAAHISEHDTASSGTLIE